MSRHSHLVGGDATGYVLSSACLPGVRVVVRLFLTLVCPGLKTLVQATTCPTHVLVLSSAKWPPIYALSSVVTRRVRPTRPTAPARSLEWGGVLRGARASCSHAGAAVGGDVDKKRHRLSRKVATLPYTNNRTEQTTTVNRDYGRPKILGLHDPTQDTLKGTLSSLWGSSGARCSSAASSQTCPCSTSRQARRPCPLRQHGGAGTGRTVANPLACPCSPASR